MKYLIIVTLAAFLITATGAFQCYQCEYYEGDSKTNPKCNEETVPTELLTTCTLPGGGNPANWQCAKKTGKTVEDEKKYVSRYCAPGKNYENSCKESDGLDSPYGTIEKAFKCYCAGDKCNGASLFTATVMLPLIGLIGYTLH